MSVLSFPRIYFKGEMMWNPDTENNTAKLYNEKENSVNFEVFDLNNETFQDYITYQGSLCLGLWNYYGDHACSFLQYKDFTSKITGGVLSKGEPTLDSDPLIQQPIEIAGNTFGGRSSPPRLVDVNPYASHTSQIFFNSFIIGTDGAQIIAPRVQRMHSYWINFDRNFNTSGKLIIAGGASAVWQASIPFDQLTINNQDNSPLLSALVEAMQKPSAQGLMIRFCSYRTLYFQNGIRNDIEPQPRDSLALQNDYHAGKIFSNPAYSLIVGSIGVWDEGERNSAPSGRYLIPPMTLNKKTSKYERQSVSPRDNCGQSEEFCADSENKENCFKPLGQVLAELDETNRVLHLDLINTIPECNGGDINNTNIGPEKADFGSIKIQAIADDGQITDITTLPYTAYDRATYEAQGGIIDIWLDKLAGQDSDQLIEKIKAGRLAFSIDQHNGPVKALEEEPLTAVTDSRGIYLEEGESQTCTIQVLYKGAPPPPDMSLKLRVVQYVDVDGMPTLIDEEKITKASLNQAPVFNRNMEAVQPTNDTATAESTNDKKLKPIVTIKQHIVSVDANGLANIELSAFSPGCATIWLKPFRESEPTPRPNKLLDITYSDYLVLRVLPFDNQLAAQTPDDALTWPFMYENIFQVYNLIYPIMSQVIPLDNKQQVEAAYMQIQALINPDMFESTLYMPISRDLSAGKTELLDRWCNLVSRRNQPDQKRNRLKQ